MNSPVQYEIVFSGEIVFKERLENVKQQMAAMFQMDPLEVEALFTGEPVVVKKNLTKDMAEVYRLTIAKAGAISKVVEMDSLQESAHNPFAEREQDVSHSIDAPTCVCPKCGHEQLEAKKCNQCSVNFEEFQVNEKLQKERESREHWLAVKAEEAQLKEEAEQRRDAGWQGLVATVVGIVVLAAAAVALAVYLDLAQPIAGSLIPTELSPINDAIPSDQ